MKLNYLTQAVSIGLATFALTACGGSDDGSAIYGVQDTPSPITPTITPTETTPATALVAPTPNFIELAKQAGLTDANAALFAETVKNMTVDSQEYQNALAQAIEAQKNADAIKTNSDAVSSVVAKANPFINGIDVSKTITVGSSHYVRQLGSNYERVSNPEAIAALGTVATEEPTNPWLSNYVLGVEAVRQADGTYKVVAIDSAGEMVVANPTATNPNQGQKLGRISGREEAYNGDETATIENKDTRLKSSSNSKDSPYYSEEYNGLMYKTQRLDGSSMLYNYGQYTTRDAIGRTDRNLGNGANESKVKTLQEMNSQHSTMPRSKLIENAMLAAKGKNYNQYPDNPNASATNNSPTPYINTGNSKPKRGGSNVPFGYSDYTRSGLLVYNDDSRPVGSEIGNKLGHKMPSWGQEENVYMMNEKTGELDVINGVDVGVLTDSIKDPATKISPTRTARGGWNASRYGSLETIYNETGETLFTNGKTSNSSYDAILDESIMVANSNMIRLFGKNMLGYEAGAEGEQIHNNTYTAKYNPTTGLMSKINPDKLHHVQYGRLTNNIDLISYDSITDKTRVLFREYHSSGAPNTVDTYFYRGTGHTTLEQMEDIKTRGGTYRYFGHALTYNLGPYVNTAEVTGNGIPTAYGSQVNMSSGNTIGNFVEATFDARKSEVTGTIYNFINHDVTKDENDFKKQTLASFKGDVFGNTVVGTANKAGTNEVGSLTASFFGASAREMGGQISSISREQGYGDPKWGAVFGATRGTTIDNFAVVEK